jgi:hypothetical protein
VSNGAIVHGWKVPLEDWRWSLGWLLLVAIVWRFSEYALVILACAYAAAGVSLHVVRFVRHRQVSHRTAA